MTSKRIAVIGSNSFSGSSFTDYCLENGFEVLGISRSEEANEVFLPYRLSKKSLSGFKFVQGDINSDLPKIVSSIKDFSPSIVVDFAAQGMVAQSWQFPEHWMQTNVVGKVRLHNELRHLKCLEKFVQVSTPEVYGSTDRSIVESTMYAPSTPYAVSRAAADLSLMTFFKQYNFPVVFTRAANVFGPSQQLYRIIPKAVLALQFGTKIPLQGGGKSVRSFIHIRDVCAATLKIANKAPSGEIYHIATDKMISIVDLVSLICRKMDKQFDECVEMTPERPGKDMAYILDSSKLRSSLGWQDQVELERGIEEVILWADRYRDTLSKMPGDYIHKP